MSKDNEQRAINNKQKTAARPGKKETKRLRELEEQVTELTADLKRTQADFVNFKRRSEQENQQTMQFAKEQVVLQLLPLLDNMQRALTHLPDELADNAWANGVAKIGEQAQGVLSELGVEPIAALGQQIDPTLHEAVNFEDSDPSTGSGQGAIDMVTAELQTGYKLGDRVIRPSMVKVARTNSPSRPESFGASQDKLRDSEGEGSSKQEEEWPDANLKS